MNLVLLEPNEVDPTGRAVITGRRHAHLRSVLDATPGRELRAGLLDGPLGHATVVAVDATSLVLQCRFDAEPPPEPTDVLLLAVPRPKVLGRVLQHATALGFGRIVLFRSWRVDKSHLHSHALDVATLREHLLLGLEQGRRTHLPKVLRFDLFRPFVEDHLPAIPPAHAARFVCDGDAMTSSADVRLAADAPLAIAIGPERGFTAYEVDCFASNGFVPLRLPTGVLRVETAVAVAHAQLALLRELARAPDRAP